LQGRISSLQQDLKALKAHLLQSQILNVSPALKSAQVHPGAAPKELSCGSLVLDIKRVWTYYRVSTKAHEDLNSFAIKCCGYSAFLRI
jgi:hypothetical protein